MPFGRSDAGQGNLSECQRKSGEASLLRRGCKPLSKCLCNLRTALLRGHLSRGLRMQTTLPTGAFGSMSTQARSRNGTEDEDRELGGKPYQVMTVAGCFAERLSQVLRSSTSLRIMPMMIWIFPGLEHPRKLPKPKPTTASEAELHLRFLVPVRGRCTDPDLSLEG